MLRDKILITGLYLSKKLTNFEIKIYIYAGVFLICIINFIHEYGFVMKSNKNCRHDKLHFVTCIKYGPKHLSLP